MNRTRWSGLADQALLSFSGLGIVLLGSVLLEASDMGVLATAVALVQFPVAMARGIVGESLIIRGAGWARAETEGYVTVRLAVWSAFIIGVMVAPISVGLVLLSSFPLPLTAAASVLLPLILVGDVARYNWLAEGKMTRLMTMDASVVLAQVLLLVLVVLVDPSTGLLFVAWAAPLTALIVPLGFSSRHRSEVATAKSWSASRSSMGAYSIESVIGAASNYLALAGVIAFASFSEAGQYRIILSIFGLTSFIVNVLRSLTMSDLARGLRGGDEYRKSRRFLWRGFVFVTLACALYGLLVLLAFTSGKALGISSTLLAAAGLILPAGVNRLLATLTSVPSVLAKALGITWSGTWVKFGAGLLSCVLPPLGAMGFGATGALWGSSIASLVLMGGLLILIRIHLRNLNGAGSK